jgi:hypothetical protein
MNFPHSPDLFRVFKNLLIFFEKTPLRNTPKNDAIIMMKPAKETHFVFDKQLALPDSDKSISPQKAKSEAKNNAKPVRLKKIKNSEMKTVKIMLPFIVSSNMFIGNSY